MSRLTRKEILDRLESSEISSSEAMHLLKNIQHQKVVSSLPDEQEDIKNELAIFLSKLLANETKLLVHEIDIQKTLENYGLDSLMIMRLNRELETQFGDLPRTLLFEYQTIGELCGYFLNNHYDAVKSKFTNTAQDGLKTVSDTNKILQKPSFSLTGNKMDTRNYSSVSKESEGFDEIAIIGVSGRYPKAGNLEEFWNNLKEGKDCITEVPLERWDNQVYFNPEKSKKGKSYIKWGGFMDDVDKFDPLFFNISAREAKLMDPQERLFLETVWHTIEDAGYTKETLADSKVGVFVGVMYGQYQLFGVQDMEAETDIPNSVFASVANRVSYYFNFNGPSIALDTMCSSSLTAIHLACDSLFKGESEVVVAGGVNLTLHPNKYILLSQGNFVSSDGKCRSFGAGGDGFVPGEGTGAILLKPLKKAIEDGDQIYAVIKSTSINHGGKTNGYSVPNPKAQAALIIDALKKGNIDARTVNYIEAHGTGTPLGDPLEMAGLTKAFTEADALQQCSIGSVKTNIGHLESAAGIAGITKVLLQMKHKQLVPSLYAEELNENIRLEETPFTVQKELAPWPQPVIMENNQMEYYPRRAGVSSFGAGGANAHIILEEFERKDNTKPASNNAQIIVLSAKNKDSLIVYAQSYIRFLENNLELSLEDLTFTLQHGRQAMEERLSFIAHSTEQMASKLKLAIERLKDQQDRDYKGIYTGSIYSKKPANIGGVEIKKLFEQNKLEEIAKLWVKGEKIHWNELRERNDACRISLPLYPFSKERYWINESSNEEVQEVNSSLEPALFAPVWEEQPLQNVNSGYGRRILVFWSGEENGYLADAVANCHTGDLVEKIKLGTKFNRKSHHEWEIKYTEIDSLKMLFQNMNEIDTIYFLAGITLNKDLDKLDEAQEKGVLSLYRLVKVLSGYGYTEQKITIKIMTNDTFEVLPGDKICPFSSSLTGFAKSMAKEYPRWNVSVADADIAEIKQTRQTLAGQIVNEPSIMEGEEVAYRRGSRFIRKLVPITLPSADQLPFKTNGVYFIVGGAGGIGLEIARFLADKVKAHLVLAGRSELSESQKEKLAEIEAIGGKALYIKADITNLYSLREALSKAKNRFGKINGVIHSAIVLKDKTIEFMDEGTMRSVLNPKVRGSAVLYEVFKDENLDFMAFFSSAQSFSGNAGQSNYAASCTFKDSMASYINQQSPYPISILNWGYWGSVGVVSNKEYNKRLAGQGLYSIEPHEGFKILCNTLSSLSKQVMPIKAEKSLLEGMGIDYSASTNEEISSLFLLNNDKKRPLIKEQIVSRLYKGIEDLTQLGTLMLMDAFQQMGVFHSSYQTYKIDELKAKIQLVPSYSQLYDELLNILIKAGFVEKKQQEIMTAEVVNDELIRKINEIPAEVAKFISAYPELKSHAVLVTECLKAYPNILSGKIPAPEVMFPKGSMDLVKGIYKDNDLADHYNRLVTWSVETYIKNRLPLLDSHEKIRIIEIGAGTGGTSKLVLENIQKYSDKVKYVYTDISSAFTHFGKREYGPYYNFLEFKTLNIENELTSQDIAPGEYDLVIATNVLHATKNIQNTLYNTKQLLKPNGWLIINEGTKVEDYLTLTFGLLDGWWLYEDQQYRLQGAPLLSEDTWNVLLRKIGYKEVRSFGTGNERSHTGQHVIVSENAGSLFNVVKSNQKSNREQAIIASVQPEKSRELLPLTNKTVESPINEEVVLDYIEESIIETLSLVLQMEKDTFGKDVPYTDYGVDSILAVEIINLINEKLRITLRTTDLFNYSSIKELTRYIIKAFETVSDRVVTETITDHDIVSVENEAIQHSADQSDTSSSAFDIAVIGMSGRFPGAKNLYEFWGNLASGKNSVDEIDRWDNSYYDPRPEVKGKSYCNFAGVLNDYDTFDPYFFSISPKEAERIDPKQRLFLEEAWKAIEDAGYSMRDLEGTKCGVFVGTGTGDYSRTMDGDLENLDSFAFMGNSNSILASRISYMLNLKGPSVAVDTACSSSLVSIHLACESILMGSSDMAIAGGVEVLSTPQFHILASNAGMLSSTGQCRTFDQGANGFVPGEGVGTVILKKLDKAIRDKDHIYGVIKGSAINQDGKTNGMTAPSAPSQTELECEVYEKFHIHPETITYVEAHGTGTKLGDPIEVDALTDAYQRYTDKKQYCAIGSVKTNIGHTLAAAGIAGFIKVLLCIKYKQLVPSLHYEKSNDFISFEQSAFYVNNELKKWESETHPRRAAISAFGFSGTNAHMVIEEVSSPKREEIQSVPRPYHLILISAKSVKVFRDKIEELYYWLKGEGQNNRLEDLAFTLAAGRNHYSVRAAIVVDSIEQLKLSLKKLSKNEQIENGFYNSVKEKRFKPDPAVQQQALELMHELREEQLINKLFQSKVLHLGKLYSQGYDLKWETLYQGEYYRISIPVYPFEKLKFWTNSNSSKQNSEELLNKRLHPLVEENISTLMEQKYVTRFTGKEFYLEDHVIFGQKILPGVAYLEMARAACGLAEGQTIQSLKSIIWASPIIVDDQSKEIYATVYPNKDSNRFEIFSEDHNQNKVIHAQGMVSSQILSSNSDGEWINIKNIKERVTETYQKGSDLYSYIKEKGLNLGDRFKAIKEIYGNSIEALALLELPEEIDHSFDQYVLHPALMDAALLSIAGIKTESGSNKLYIPFSIDEVKVLKPMRRRCYAHVTLAQSKKPIDFNTSKFSIVIADEEGNVLVKLENFLGRIVHKEVEQQLNSIPDEEVLTIFHKIESGELSIEEVELMTGAIV
ncbi:SDR family NAD(P)-dependent oxidoreductase [Fictibacillus phosphorivorans]|uniref:SDR family NAD(P)-dependent oxidoreductase n=1 Tax=Fictibacillus phosphorivorans TaxID=1221500 RepID=UPI003CE71201